MRNTKQDDTADRQSKTISSTQASGQGALMADLSEALKALGLDALDLENIAFEFREPLIRLAGTWKTSIATSTLASRQCDLRRFIQWCKTQRPAPFSSSHSLPELMEAHISWVGKSLSAGTTQRVGSSLSALANALGTDQSSRGTQERRRLAVRAAQKTDTAVGTLHPKPRLTVSQMQSMRRNIESADILPLRQLRDLAIFDIMCDLLSRRSEICCLRLRDLDLPSNAIRISYSKTDQSGRGTIFHISPRTVASTEAWLAASDIQNLQVPDAGVLPVFTGIMNDEKIRLGRRGLPEPMDGKSIARILQRYTEPLGIIGVAGHSIRRSMARALYEAGVPENEIVKKGRWSSLEQMREYVGLTAPIQGAVDLIF